jgi:hypothetical protein
MRKPTFFWLRSIALYYSTMGKLQALWFISMLLSDIWVASLHHSQPKEPFLIVGKHDIED